MNDGKRRYADVPRTTERIRSDVDDEIRFDIDMRVRELVGDGLTEADARARALEEFGDVEATRRYCADVDARQERTSLTRRWLVDLADDLAFAWRAIRKAPAFAAVVLLTLAAGLGVNIALYSVVRRVLIDRLPYRSADELVRLYAGVAPTGGSNFFTPTELRDLQGVPSFAAVGAFGGLGSTVYYGEQESLSLPVASVTPNFFRLLGAAPLMGRAFGESDVAPDAPHVTMISYDLWQTAFNADPKIIGRVIRTVAASYTVVGVLPREFVGPGFSADIWHVLDVRRLLGNPAAAATRGFRPIARLKPGATRERATADADVLASRWRSANMITANTPSPRIESLRDAMVGDVRLPLLAVMGAALLVLVITCTNVAGLFLARATARRREIAVRTALGAGRGRLIRQLLAEAMLYGLLGGICGVVVALLVEPALVRTANDALPNLGPIQIDLRLMLTALAASLACGAAFGVMPAIAATRIDLRETIGEGARGASSGSERVRARQLLVAAQIALAGVLMAGAGLLLQSFNHLVAADVGYATDEKVLIFTMNAGKSQPDQNARNAAVAAASTRVSALPGIVSTGVTSVGPWNGPRDAMIRRESSAPAEQGVHVDYITANEGYFDAIGTRVLRGRAIASTDRPDAMPVMLLSETAARRLFGTEDPIGKRAYVDSTLHEIVGLVNDVRPYATSDPSASIYVSDWQENRSWWPQFIIRTRGDASLLVPSLRRLVHEINPTSPLMYARTMTQVMDTHLAPHRLSLMLFALFALLAVTLAALGVYGVMSYVVAARTREFGIRSALGARRSTLIALVFRWGMMSTLAGGTIGVVAALLGAGMLSKLVVGVSTRDPMTFVVVPAVLIAVTLVACGIPAWRATRVDPADALRAD